MYYKDRLLAIVEGKEVPREPSRQDMLVKSASSAATSTEALPGESDADYVARQRMLQEQARERLRQKFGAANGLSSGGNMQAIGSDPSYRPGSNQATLPVDLNGLLSTSLNLLGEGVKATTEIAGKTVATVQEKWAKPAANGGGDGGQGGWSTIATGAVGLWKQASTLIAAPTEDELKFPRPEGVSGGGSKEGRISQSNSAASFASQISAGDSGYQGSVDGGYRSNTSSPAFSRGESAGKKASNVKASDGWDDFDNDSDNPQPAPTSSSKRERPPRAAPRPDPVSSAPPPPPMRSQSQPTVPSSASSGNLSGKGKPAAPSGSQEDFFASFGV